MVCAIFPFTGHTVERHQTQIPQQKSRHVWKTETSGKLLQNSDDDDDDDGGGGGGGGGDYDDDDYDVWDT